MNRQAAAFIAGLMGVAGLIAALIITLFMDELEQERLLLLGGLIAMTAGATQWFFRNGSK